MLAQVQLENGQKVIKPLSGTAPVNSVEEGNYNAVTSNAVADYLKWVDISDSVTISRYATNASATTYTIQSKKVLLNKAGFIDVKYELVLTSNMAAGSHFTLQQSITSSLFSTANKYASGSWYYDKNVASIQLNVYEGETNVVSARVNCVSQLASGAVIGYRMIIPVDIV